MFGTTFCGCSVDSRLLCVDMRMISSMLLPQYAILRMRSLLSKQQVQSRQQTSLQHQYSTPKRQSTA
jgi:hypothetical protein